MKEVPFALVLDGIGVIQFLGHVFGDVVKDEFVASFGGGFVGTVVPFMSKSWLMK